MLRFIFILGFALSLHAFACDVSAKKEMIDVASDGRTVVWTMPKDALVSSAVSDERYFQYLSWVHKNTSLDARGLIHNQDEYFRRQLVGRSANNDLYQYLVDAVEKSHRILSGAVGRFRKVSCLEVLAFAETLSLFDLTTGAREFYVHVFSKDGVVQVVGNFYDRNTGVNSAPAEKRFTELQREGWTYEVNLHNHPFNFFLFQSTPVFGTEQIGGNIHPSDPDVNTYRRLRPREAWVTNGVETLVIPEKDFDRLAD